MVDEIRIIGARVRALREHRGWTQGQLAYKAHTVAAQISRIEHNERPGAQARLVAQIAAALDVSMDYLMGRTNDPQMAGDGEIINPEIVTTALEVQRIWREVDAVDPEAAQRLMGIAVTQAEAFRVAVNAARERMERREKQEQE